LHVCDAALEALPDEQQLLLLEKDNNDTVSTREVLPVRFSQLEETG
jgi:hypothetical protein